MYSPLAQPFDSYENRTWPRLYSFADLNHFPNLPKPLKPTYKKQVSWKDDLVQVVTIEQDEDEKNYERNLTLERLALARVKQEMVRTYATARFLN